MSASKAAPGSEDWYAELIDGGLDEAAPKASRHDSIEFAIFTNSNGPITKRISFANNDIVSHPAAQIWKGQARRIRTDELPGETAFHAIAGLIKNMTPNQALSLGRIVEEAGDNPAVVTKKQQKAEPKPGVISRSTEFLHFATGEPAPMLVDFDQKGMPDDIKERIKAAEGMWNVLAEVVPALTGAGRISRASTSAGIYHPETKQRSSSGGEHHYMIAADGSDIERALKDLHDHMWFHGLGWYMIGAAGQLLDRSIVDRTVWSPERLVFEGAPMVDPPLKQDQSVREPVVVDGAILDTETAIPRLTAAERDIVKSLKEEARRRLKPEADRVQTRSDRALAEQISEEKRIHFATALRHVEVRHEGKLVPVMPLVFDDDDIGTVTVGDILDNPDSFVGETLADPQEGVNYGRCKAMVMRRVDGTLFIHSFAHGRTFYELVFDAARLRKEIERASRQSAVDVLVANLLRTHLEVDELVQLIALAAERAGVGVGVIKARIKKARDAHAKKEAERAAAEQPIDGRISFPLPAEDAELTAVMQRIDSVLSQVEDPEPPMRSVGGVLCEIRERTPLGLHELTSRNNEKSEERLPAPAEPLITELDRDGTTIAIERHIRHTNRREANSRLQPNFASAYQTYSDSALPRVIGVVTAPLVTETGILATNGLDRERKLVFRIDPMLLRLIPEDVSNKEAEQYYRFLVDEWLCDVLTGDEGKAIIVAAALTLIERLLLPDRPAFFITAGQRGGGKTTLANMLSTAVLGRRAPMAVWSENREERRKALISYLRESPATLVWDNLPNGASISCPTIEQSLTSPIIEDRILGRSEKVTVPTTTIQFFTGNNVLPSGDLASRSLVARLNVDRPDPENRDFKKLSERRGSGATSSRLRWQGLGDAQTTRLHQAASRLAMYRWIDATVILRDRPSLNDWSSPAVISS